MVKRANSKFAEMTLTAKVPFGSWSFLGGACVVLISVRAGGSAGCSCVWKDWTMSSTFSVYSSFLRNNGILSLLCLVLINNF
jgi:hypothetical protein